MAVVGFWFKIIVLVLSIFAALVFAGNAYYYNRIARAQGCLTNSGHVITQQQAEILLYLNAFLCIAFLGVLIWSIMELLLGSR